MGGRSFINRDENTIECYLQLPTMLQRASRRYGMCPWINDNGCGNLKRVWEKDLSLTIDEKTWEEIISNSEKYIREGRGKFSIK